MFADWYERYLERQKIRIVLVIIVLFFTSMFMSCQELHYMISGKTIDAAMSTRVETVRDGDTTRQHRVLCYSFTDGKIDHQEYVDVPMDWPHAHAQTVKVQYVPGHPTMTRVQGQNNMGWVYVFGASIAATGIAMFWVGRKQ